MYFAKIDGFIATLSFTRAIMLYLVCLVAFGFMLQIFRNEEVYLFSYLTIFATMLSFLSILNVLTGHAVHSGQYILKPISSFKHRRYVHWLYWTLQCHTKLAYAYLYVFCVNIEAKDKQLKISNRNMPTRFFLSMYLIVYEFFQYFKLQQYILPYMRIWNAQQIYFFLLDCNNW